MVAATVEVVAIEINNGCSRKELHNAHEYACDGDKLNPVSFSGYYSVVDANGKSVVRSVAFDAFIYGLAHGKQRDGKNFVVTALIESDEALLDARVVSFKFDTQRRRGRLFLSPQSPS